MPYLPLEDHLPGITGLLEYSIVLLIQSVNRYVDDLSTVTPSHPAFYKGLAVRNIVIKFANKLGKEQAQNPTSEKYFIQDNNSNNSIPTDFMLR